MVHLRFPVELWKSGEAISERTVAKYLREMDIRAQWTRPWIATTKDSDFSKELQNILNEQPGTSEQKNYRFSPISENN